MEAERVEESYPVGGSLVTNLSVVIHHLLLLLLNHILNHFLSECPWCHTLSKNFKEFSREVEARASIPNNLNPYRHFLDEFNRVVNLG